MCAAIVMMIKQTSIASCIESITWRTSRIDDVSFRNEVTITKIIDTDNVIMPYKTFSVIFFV